MGNEDATLCCGGRRSSKPRSSCLQAGNAMEVEVAGWREGQYGQRIWIRGRDLPVNWLYRDNYEAIRDDTDYSVAR
jgi:hypothetical protein